MREQQQIALLGRQPIIGRSGAVAGYELLFRRHLRRNAADVPDEADATDQVILNTIGVFGITQVLGAHRGYVNIGESSLDSDMLGMLPPKRFVLELLESVRFNTAVERECWRLRQAGYKIAIDDVVTLSQIPPHLLAVVDIVKVDVRGVSHDELPRILSAARHAGCTTLAEKVETHEEHARMYALGFDLFQGYYFARPEVIHQRRVAVSQSALLALLEVLTGEPTVAQLECAVKQCPTVVTKVMKLAGSAGSGATSAPATVREAITRVGTRCLSRWTQLMLFGESTHLSLDDNPLVQLVATRAHFMELLARELHPRSEGLWDDAFQAGVFSLMHIVTGQTPAALLSQLSLRASVREAILRHEGELGQMLALAEVMEGQNPDFVLGELLCPALAARTIMTLHTRAAIGIGLGPVHG
jgi:c-di-GMP-related signal transduction protein